MKALLALGVLLAASACGPTADASAPTLVGEWNVAHTLDGVPRVLRLEAEAGGKGSLLLRDPRSSLVEPAEASEALWKEIGSERVMFSGPVEFPIGNVGREAGTLMFKGRFSTAEVILGEVAFFPPGQEPIDPAATPSRTGSFKATRVASRMP